jgi:hypothetical protein
MTSQSPRIYLYKITFQEVSYYYYGVHKEKTFNEDYWGSPVTNKWVWDFYTPKKQILQLFDFTDEGWLEAQEVESRIIKPVYNIDKWCLNKNCGGKVSLEISRKTGKISGKKAKELGIGIHGRTKEQMSENGKKSGKIGGKKSKEHGVGIHGRTKEQMTEDGSKGGKKAKELGLGFHRRTKEQMTEDGKKGYSNGLASITKEERTEIVAKTNSQRWMCLETEYVSTAGGIVSYQKGRKIDTSKNNRKRIS